MIITEQKPYEEVIEQLREVGADTVSIVGCGQCATLVETGGAEQVDAWASKLTEAGFEVVEKFVSDTGCHVSHVGVELRRSDIDKADAIVVLSCGAGVQTIADFKDETPVFPGLNSLFVGNTFRRGEFEERCRTCGSCGIGRMGGICPLTRCAKGLLNGPCGSMWDGMCGESDRPCIHVVIRQRLARQGRLTLPILPPKDYSPKSAPGSVSRERAHKGGE